MSLKRLFHWSCDVNLSSEFMDIDKMCECIDMNLGGFKPISKQTYGMPRGWFYYTDNNEVKHCCSNCADTLLKENKVKIDKKDKNRIVFVN